MNSTANRKELKVNTHNLIHHRGILLVVLLFFALCPGLAFSHSPQDIELSYDAATQSLKVNITHTSKSPSKHYIKKVEIIKNGVVVSSNNYNMQPDISNFSYNYKVPVGTSDVLEVKATCSILGSKTKKLTATGPSKELR